VKDEEEWKTVGAEKKDSGTADESSAEDDEGRRDDSKKSDDSHNKDKEDDDKKDDKEAGKPKSKKPIIILIVIVLVLLLGGFIAWFVTRNQVSTDDAYTDGNAVTMVPKVSGYVVELFIDDNAHVKKGDLLLRIDPRDSLTARSQALAQLALAKAQLDSSQVAYDIAKVQYPAQLQSAEAQHRSAIASLQQARQSYARQRGVDRRATTQENIDQADTQQAGAAASVRSAEAQVAVARLVPEQLRQAATTVTQRQAAVQQAQAQLDQADLNLSYTEVRAPQDGFITLRNVQLGTFLTAGQVMFVLVTPDVWVTANYKESQIGRMRPGDRVEVTIDAYHGLKLYGHVQSIQYGSGSRFSAFPAENATGNFVKIVQRVPVKILIDRGLDPERPLPIGLSVSPTVYFP
jgi:membrane fusion protein, multidrug efflux system